MSIYKGIYYRKVSRDLCHLVQGISIMSFDKRGNGFKGEGYMGQGREVETPGQDMVVIELLEGQ